MILFFGDSFPRFEGWLLHGLLAEVRFGEEFVLL